MRHERDRAAPPGHGLGWAGLGWAAERGIAAAPVLFFFLPFVTAAVPPWRIGSGAGESLFEQRDTLGCFFVLLTRAAGGETMIKSSWFYVKFKYAEKVSGTSALLPHPDPSGTENFPGALGERGARRPMGEHRSVRGGTDGSGAQI